MKYAVFAFLSICLLAFTTADTESVFVAQLTAEGARSGKGSNPFEDWLYGENEITSMGLRQQYLVGYDFAELYAKKLNLNDRVYSPWQVNIKSTNHNVTLMGAQAQLEGIYPPGMRTGLTSKQAEIAVPPGNNDLIAADIKKLGNDIMPDNFQTLPIHANDFDKDTILMSDWCSKISQTTAQSVNDTEWEKTMSTKYADALKSVRDYVNKPDLTIHDVYGYIDSIYAKKFNRDSIGSLENQYAKLMEFRFEYFDKMWSSEEARKLFTNGFAGELHR